MSGDLLGALLTIALAVPLFLWSAPDSATGEESLADSPMDLTGWACLIYVTTGGAYLAYQDGISIPLILASFASMVIISMILGRGISAGEQTKQ